MADDDLDAIAESLRAHEARSRRAEHQALRDRLAPEHIDRIGLTPGPREPEVGNGPFTETILLGRRVVGRRNISLAPRDMDIDVTYLSPGVPSTVVRADDLSPVISTVINWTVPGSIVANVVITHDDGRVVTCTPVYSGTDITHIDRVVT